MWQVLKRVVVHDAWPWVRLSYDHVRLPNGHEIPDFYRVEIAPYVMIFAQCEDGRVVMVEHYKHGPGYVSLELPAGYIEQGEDPLSSAQRELREETGFASGDWQPLGTYFIDGNRGCGWVHSYLARAATYAGEPQREADELITMRFYTLDEVYTLWQSGQITNVAAALTIGRSLLEVGYLKRGKEV